MQLKLSCYCCGSEDFKPIKIEDVIKVEGDTYLYQEDVKDNIVYCKKCGLKDYIKNLPIKFTE